LYAHAVIDLKAPTRCVQLAYTTNADEAYGVIPMSWVVQTCQILPDLQYYEGRAAVGNGRFYVNKYFWGSYE
jgi:hypothetical protein